MSKSYSKVKGRGSGTPTFFLLLHEVLRCPNYIKLSKSGRALLNEIGLLYNGSNNGNLAVTLSYLKDRGFKSQETITNLTCELVHYGFIVRTQYGGTNFKTQKCPNLYALSWFEINHIGKPNKLMPKIEWKVGDTPRTWKNEKPMYERPRKSHYQKKTPPKIESNRYENRI